MKFVFHKTPVKLEIVVTRESCYFRKSDKAESSWQLSTIRCFQIGTRVAWHRYIVHPVSISGLTPTQEVIIAMLLGIRSSLTRILARV